MTVGRAAPGPCRDRLDAALAAVAGYGAGAVVLTWPAGHPIPAGGDDARHEHPANPRLAWLIAAKLAAALPTELSLPAELSRPADVPLPAAASPAAGVPAIITVPTAADVS